MPHLLLKDFTMTSEEEQRLILSWRNSRRIRSKMLTQEIIPWEKHWAFVQSLAQREHSAYYLVYADNTPVGVISHVEYDREKGSCSGGLYMGDSSYSGLGIALMYYDLQHIFENLGVGRYWFCVLKSNKRVYRMHKAYFGAIDDYETDTEWYCHYDATSWKEIKARLGPVMHEVYGISGMEVYQPTK